MPSFPIIGIAGRALTGKDTIASLIITAIGGYRYSFADPIRAMLKPLGIDMDDLYWQAHKEATIPSLGVSPRRMMQTLGTDWGRCMINANLWTELAARRLFQNGTGMVIPDVRFENEATWVREQGGLIIHVTRPAANAVENHVSEDGINVLPEDMQVVNDGTLDDLYISVNELLRGFY